MFLTKIFFLLKLAKQKLLSCNRNDFNWNWSKRDRAPLEFVLKKLTGIGNKRTYSQDLVSKRGSATRKLVQKGNILSWNCYKKGTLSFLELVPKGNVLPWNQYQIGKICTPLELVDKNNVLPWNQYQKCLSSPQPPLPPLPHLPIVLIFTYSATQPILLQSSL